MLDSSGFAEVRLVVRILLVTAAYFVAGRVSLLLAIPPGFVTGLFLPIGIALGALLIWGLPLVVGVVLGSTLLNISIALASGQSLNIAVVAVAVEIACGSGLASVSGALLIRRFIGFPDNLTDERTIFLFFILGGPVATCVSASVGVLTLYGNGIIPLQQLFYSWWTWWIGDAIGVLIATPLMCILFAEPRHFWRNRLATVALPLVLSSLVVVAVFVIASVNEQRKVANQFEQGARLVSESITDSFSSVEYALIALSGLFIASDHVSREEFSAYINHVILKKTGISGFSWNQYIKNTERAQHEVEMQEQGFENYFIKEKKSSGEIIKAPTQDDYVVIAYVEPWARNGSIQGFNMGNNPLRREALNRARDSGDFVITQPLQLLQDKPGAPGIIAYYPVYKKIQPPLTLAEKQASLSGYATAIVRTNELLEEALKSFKKENYQLDMVDITVPGSPLIFFTMGDHSLPAYAEGLVFTEEIHVGGRHLLVKLSPTKKFLSEQVSLQSWFVLAGGLLFCSLLGGFLLLVSGRAQHVQDLVDQRTKELAAILENAVESILVVDERGYIQKANPAAEQLFKLPIDDFFQLPISELIPELQSKFSEKGTTLEAGKISEAIGRCGDDCETPIEMSVSQVNMRDRQLFTFIIHDVSARRKIDRMKSEFISTVSHELRTPLTSIRGALGIAVSGNFGEVPSKLLELLQIARSNSDRLSRLVNDILDIEKLEFNKIQLSVQESQVYPLLQQAIEQNQGYASRYHIHLKLAKPEDTDLSLSANLDVDRFLQVMSNLISNAIKFCRTDGQVSVSLSREDSSVKITVVDQGNGIPEEFRSRIFQKFAQADSSDSRHRDGTGLGLSITKVIVERLGGTINYTSIQGQGTTFWIMFPLVAPT